MIYLLEVEPKFSFLNFKKKLITQRKIRPIF
jgi:hypothetical protein